jgi:hypothetical protein
MSDTTSAEDVRSEQRRLHREYVEARYSQLSELESSSSDSVYHYLFNINAGAAVAVLTFIGTSAEIAKLCKSHYALGAFVFGVLMCGAFRAFHIHWATKLFETWRRNYDTYERGYMDWDDVMEEDAELSPTPKALWILGYASAASFVVGCIFALSILTELKKKEAAPTNESAVAAESVTTKGS